VQRSVNSAVAALRRTDVQALRLLQQTIDSVAYKHQKFLSHSSGKFKIKVLANLVSHKDPLTGPQTVPSSCVLTTLRELFFKGTNSLYKDRAFMTYPPPKAPMS
jgi:hypothetical protein